MYALAHKWELYEFINPCSRQRRLTFVRNQPWSTYKGTARCKSYRSTGMYSCIPAISCSFLIPRSLALSPRHPISPVAGNPFLFPYRHTANVADHRSQSAQEPRIEIWSMRPLSAGDSSTIINICTPSDFHQIRTSPCHHISQWCICVSVSAASEPHADSHTYVGETTWQIGSVSAGDLHPHVIACPVDAQQERHHLCTGKTWRESRLRHPPTPPMIVHHKQEVAGKAWSRCRFTRLFESLLVVGRWEIRGLITGKVTGNRPGGTWRCC